MRMLKILLRGAQRMVPLLVASAILFAHRTADAADQFLPLLKTKTATYTNATVTTKTKSYVFVLHSTGMANLKVQDLSEDAQRELGYLKSEETSKQPAVVFAKQLVPNIETKLQPLQNQLKQQMPWMQQIKIDRTMIYTVLGIFLAGYLFWCFCCHLICIKSKKAPSILVWIPGLQMIPLLRAADMSAWWFLAYLVPPLGLIPAILWAFNIAKVRGKGVLLSILLILPLTNIFAFLYLAFAREAPAEEAPRYKSMALQTA